MGKGELPDGEYTMQQKSNMKFLDAFENETHDYCACVRPAQGNDSQIWLCEATGDGAYAIQQKVNMRFLDAYENSNHCVVTRTAQGNDSQKWLFKATSDGAYTIQQKVNMRFLDAASDSVAFTQGAQGNDTQKWVIKATSGPPSKKPRLAERVHGPSKIIDWGAADPSKWSFPKVEYSGAYKFYSAPQLEEINGSISKGLEDLKLHPQSYDGVMYQSNMFDWPKDQQKYQLVKRTGSGFHVSPQPGGGFTWVQVRYEALPSNVTVTPDAYTNSMSYNRYALGPGLMPGRGQGCCDIPDIRLISGAHPCDVRQGTSVGNCWLLGAMSAMAEYKGAIAKLFSKTSTLADRPLDAFNHYTVTLWDLSGSEWKPVDITIDERLCTKPNENVLLGASPTVNGHLWCCYLEKAVAAHCGGWDEIDGGNSTHGWRLLTGCKEVYTIRSEHGSYACFGTFNPNEKVWEQLHNSPKKGFQSLWPMHWPEVGGGGGMHLKLNRDQLFDRLIAWDKANFMIAAVSEDGSDDDHRDGIVYGHAYTILECLRNSGGVDVSISKVRNPWGKGEFTAGRWIDKGSGWRDHPQVKAVCHPEVVDDGAFWMEKDELFEYFPAFYVCALDMSTFQ